MNNTYTSELRELIARGKEGSNKGYSLGLPDLETIIYGGLPSTYTIVGGQTGSGDKKTC